jgi:O-antigen ligase
MVMVLPLSLAAATARAQAARGPFTERWRDWLQWLGTPDASRFVFAAVAVLVMMVALVLSGSRSGLASAVVAIATLGYFASRGRRRQGRIKRVLPALYLLLVVAFAVGWVGIDRTVARFADVRVELRERLSAWSDTWRIARDFPVAGVGFGSYGRAMLVYQTAERHSIYEQAHNEYLQILAEGGALVAFPAAIALFVLLANVRHRFRGQDPPDAYWLRAGAAAGLMGIAAQSFFDFSLQMPGNAMMFAVLAAIAVHRPSGHHANRV